MIVKRTRDLMAQSWESEANLSVFLFLMILLVFVFPSLGIGVKHVALYADIGVSVILIVGTGIAWGNPRLFMLTSLVSVLAIVAKWSAWWMPTNTLVLLNQVLELAAIVAIITVLLRQVFRAGPITGLRIQGAIAAYLCLAFWWAQAYHIADLLVPGSFHTSGIYPADVSEWINYSFGMLTTVGYGQIVPVTPIVHTLTSAEAVTGPLYLAVLVARLVSLQLTSERK